MVVFYGINKEVLPLKANLVIQEGRLNKANAELATAQAQLDEKERELNVVKAQYDAAMTKKQALIGKIKHKIIPEIYCVLACYLVDDAEACKRRMNAASALIGGLGGEKERWTQQSKMFEAQLTKYAMCNHNGNLLH